MMVQAGLSWVDVRVPEDEWGKCWFVVFFFAVPLLCSFPSSFADPFPCSFSCSSYDECNVLFCYVRRKAKMPFGQMPVLCAKGEAMIAQSRAIERYIATYCGMCRPVFFLLCTALHCTATFYPVSFWIVRPLNLCLGPLDMQVSMAVIRSRTPRLT
jgi:hypothetical protein